MRLLCRRRGAQISYRYDELEWTKIVTAGRDGSLSQVFEIFFCYLDSGCFIEFCFAKCFGSLSAWND